MKRLENYTVKSLVTADAACLGTLTFASAFPLKLRLVHPARGADDPDDPDRSQHRVPGTATKVSE